MSEPIVEGIDRLFVNFNIVDERVVKAAQKGLANAGMQIIADAQRNIRTAGHEGGTLSTTGQLSNSGRTQVLANGEVEVGFYSASGSRGYAAAVEYGSRPHWMPTAPLAQWVKKKLGLKGDDADTAVFFIKRWIAKHGTKAHPFFTPAVTKNHKAICTAISDAVAEVTKNDIK